jgi:hypothetical protein
MLKDRLVTAMHPIEIAQGEHRLGINHRVEGLKTLQDMHTSFRSLRSYRKGHLHQSLGTITTPVRGRKKKAGNL